MFILASASPQRKTILKKLNVRFRTIPSHISEVVRGVKTPEELVRAIALKKANHVAKNHPHEWVIGVDTLVFLANGRKAGKPKSKAEARKIIQQFSGSHCDVMSGMAIVCRKKKKQLFGFETTRLFFRNVKSKEIENYLKTGEWKGRSGAMTLEGRGGAFVTRIVGDYWNVIGLPTLLFQRMKQSAKMAFGS